MKRAIDLLKGIIVIAAFACVILFAIPSHAEGQWMSGAGGWWYSYPDGSYATGWAEIDGAWYYFDSSGYNKTGWVQSGGAWYYMQASGQMFTGWLLDGGSWYYLEPSGAMKTGWMQTEDGTWYYFKSSGAMATGWAQSEYSGTWYYFDGNGAMQSNGWIASGGYWYFLEPSGAMKTGWMQAEDGTWYFLNPSGDMATGWVLTGGYWYYFSSSGAMQTGVIYDGTGWYDLGDSGALADSTSQKAQGYSSPTGYLILVDRGAHMVHVYSGAYQSWTEISSFQCTDGTATPNGTFSIGSHTSHFGEEKGYSCYYATQITGEILFHSILYYPNTMNVQDGRLGITASHGCIRLAYENAQWIYNTIPSGTTVVIY